jgi:hypothetical protein
MRLTIRSMILAAPLMGAALAGCDAPPTPDATPSVPDARPSVGSLAEALEDPDPYARARNLGALLPTLGADAVLEVQQALDEFRLDLGAVEFELLLRFWALQEPAEATAWTFKRSSPLYRNAASRTVIEIWAAADPTAAVVAVESAVAEANEEVARVAQLALVQGWFQTDRPGLEAYIYGLGSGGKRQRSIYAYVLSLAAAEGSDAAIRWAESTPEDDIRYKREVYSQVASALVWADVPAAVRFCDAHCDGPYGRSLRNVLVRTRLRDGDYGGDVVEWVGRVPEGNEQQRANKRHSLWVAYATWAYRDRESAIDWMAQKIAEAEEPPPWVRLLYGEYARQLAVDSPEKAIQWAERVEDEGERELTLTRIARYWLTQDEEAAEAWLSQSSLSERAREQARNTEMPHNLPLRRGAP